LTALELPNSSK